MKRLIAVTVLALVTSFSANAAGHVGQCVYPKTKVGKTGNLEFINPVYIFSSPKATDPQPLKLFSAFTIKAESQGYIQLAMVPDYDQPDSHKNAGKVFGWAKQSDFNFVSLSSCN